VRLERLHWGQRTVGLNGRLWWIADGQLLSSLVGFKFFAHFQWCEELPGLGLITGLTNKGPNPGVAIANTLACLL
jgi:hypothetical protein